MKSSIGFIAFLLSFFVFGSCAKDSPSQVDDNGFAPGQIVGKTLILIKSKGGIFLSTDHLNESGVSINNVTVDYGKYAPSYSYSVVGTNKAEYYLQATKVTYIPLYGTYHYSKFSFNVSLNFTSKVGGTYTGTQTNANGKDSSISGNFSIN